MQGIPRARPLFRELAALWAPPPVLTVSQWADRFRQLSRESSAEPGQWQTSRVPYLREVMDSLNDPATEQVWFQKSAQVGATEALNNLVGFFMSQDPAPLLVVQPTVEMAETWSKDRLGPMIRDTAALSGLVASAKAREGTNTLLAKEFPGGRLALAGANSAAGLASRPVRVLLMDEVDRYPPSASDEGDPCNLAMKRTQTFWNRRVFACSTPTLKGHSRIEAGYLSGDQRQFWVPCPHCGEFQTLKWSQVKYDEDAPKDARYCCEHCGTLIDEVDKNGMVSRGEWRASARFNGIASFRISELYSPFSTWGRMAAQYEQDKKFPETLKTFVNTSLGEPFESQGDGVEGTGLVARRESYTAQSLPEGVLLLTAGVDVQGNRLEVSVWGWGADEEAWRVEHVVLRGDPGTPSLWNDLDELFRKRYVTDDGRELIIEAAAIDSGGHFTQTVYGYCATRKKYRLWAIKGFAGFGKLIWPKAASKAGKTSGDLFLVGVDTAKDLLYGRLRSILDDGPGYIHFDATFDQADADQISGEKIIYKMVGGRRVRRFQPVSDDAPVEQLDCFVYAYVHDFLGLDPPDFL
ncbi:MAG: phage terminase large subunit family protein [Gammaproteobacteria bacterium]|nr:phage terminase large subunit family protein [Gammaproteobacteria bacterium]